MNENENSYYNPAQLRKFQEHGVIIPDLSSVRIGREVALIKLLPAQHCSLLFRINGRTQKSMQEQILAFLVQLRSITVGLGKMLLSAV